MSSHLQRPFCACNNPESPLLIGRLVANKVLVISVISFGEIDIRVLSDQL